MARPKNPVPSYLLHKKSGQARVRLKEGSRYRDVYLGEYGSPESLDNYRQVVADYLGNGSQDPNKPGAMSPVNTGDWTVAELAVHYDDFASSHYVKNGEPTDDRYRAVISPLVSLYGSILAKDFGPKKLKSLPESIVRRGNLRTAKFDESGNLVEPGEPLSREYVNNLMKSDLAPRNESIHYVRSMVARTQKWRARDVQEATHSRADHPEATRSGSSPGTGCYGWRGLQEASDHGADVLPMEEGVRQLARGSGQATEGA